MCSSQSASKTWVETSVAKMEKAMSRTLNRLTDRRVRTAKPGMYADGGGLWLQVTAGSHDKLNRSWIFRFATDEIVISRSGKRRLRERQMGLGSFDTVSLLQARWKAAACRNFRHQGIDPITQQRAERAARRVAAARSMTFKEAARVYVAGQEAGWKNEKHRTQWANTLETYAYPILGSLPVAEIDQAIILNVLRPIWEEKTETAKRLRGRIEAVLDWAKANGYRRDGENPARWRGHLEFSLAAPSKIAPVDHHAALPYAELPAFLVKLREQEGVAARALEFTILTAARTSETIGAKLSEIDAKNKLWTVPPGRMKAGKEHRVPLSGAALAILRDTASSAPVFIFGGRKPGTPLSNMAMLMLLGRMGHSDLTVHGFRSTFRDWASECTNFPNHVADMALAHTVGDKVEAAYRRGELLEKRRQLMTAWAKYCGSAAVSIAEAA